MSIIKCDIVSAEKAIFNGEASLVVASGIEGELGIAPRHTPLMTQLKPGEIRVIQEDGSEEHFYVSGGMMEVQPYKVSILADTALRADDIDEAAAIKAKEEAEQLLQDKSKKQDLAKVQADLAKAIAQIHAVSRLKKNLKR
ncbi:F0F1 ATP synthase subunit epsilon [Marinicella sp. W31]|uniref:F0F1 ATP synthase subunit epsilon n=1 Tax=Marinicella sp. W31 TaxID=3023713 RepID=UPI00375651EC